MSTDHPMQKKKRLTRWKTALAATLFAPLLAFAQQQPSDYAREQRWADEVIPAIVVGEPVWLEAPRTKKFLAIHSETPGAGTAVILAHGMGVHPDYGIIGELRTRLAERGYTTLSIQMPILAADAPAARYPVLFREADARFAAAVSFLWRKKYRRIVLISYSMGSRMADHYIAKHPKLPLSAWISLSISSGGYTRLRNVKFPVFDVYVEHDLDPVMRGATKRAAVLKRLRGSSQTMMFATDHSFAGKEKELVMLVRLLIDGEGK